MHIANLSEEWLEAVQKIYFPVHIILYWVHKNKGDSSPEPECAHPEQGWLELLFNGF